MISTNSPITNKIKNHIDIPLSNPNRAPTSFSDSEFKSEKVMHNSNRNENSRNNMIHHSNNSSIKNDSFNNLQFSHQIDPYIEIPFLLRYYHYNFE